MDENANSYIGIFINLRLKNILKLVKNGMLQFKILKNQYILLLKNKKDKNVRIALQNGIYDLIFGNFYTSQIKDLLERPNTFKDISKLYSYNFDVKLDKDKKFRK